MGAGVGVGVGSGIGVGSGAFGTDGEAGAVGDRAGATGLTSGVGLDEVVELGVALAGFGFLAIQSSKNPF